MAIRERPRRVAAVQTAAGDDPHENLHQATALLGSLKPGDADLVCLPEMFTFRDLGSRPMVSVALEANSDVDRMLRDQARRLQATITAGVLRNTGLSMRNETVVIGPDGGPIAHYWKTHLFDAPGQVPESAHVHPGDELLVLELPWARLGFAVCYELRFPELTAQLAAAGAELLIVPNSWPADGEYGADHDLQVLLRATAVQNQAFVVHSNQVGRTGALDLCGGSGIFDPRGVPVTQLTDPKPGIAVAEVDVSRVYEARTRRPVQSHRRPELYRVPAVRPSLS